MHYTFQYVYSITETPLSESPPLWPAIWWKPPYGSQCTRIGHGTAHDQPLFSRTLHEHRPVAFVNIRRSVLHA